MAVLAVVVALLYGFVEQRMWMQAVCLVTSSYLMVELNNVNALLRIYSRMVSCAFLMLTCVSCFLFSDWQAGIVLLCWIFFYSIIFRCYQIRQASGWVFYAFLSIGIASLFFVQVLFFVPFLWIMTGKNLQALSVKSFFASLLGLIAPYWFGIVYYLANDNLDGFVSHFTEAAQFGTLFDYSMLGEHRIVTFCFVLLLTVIGVVHYLRTSFQDKIRTRMLYGIFIGMNALILVFIVLQPQHFDKLFTLFIVNTSPLIAHFITLTHTKFTNIVFHVIVFLSLSLIAYNLWMPSLIF